MSEPYYCWAIRNKEGYFLSSKYTEFYQIHCNTFFSDKQDCLERIKKSKLKDCEPVQIKMQIAPNW